MAEIFGIGHGTTPIRDFIEILRRNNIETLVDVRSRPFSRFNPQFNRKAFAECLEAAGIKYEWRGNNLGGLDKNVNEHETIVEMAKRAEAGERIALCCSETDKMKCHRHSSLSPQLTALGLTFVNIEKKGHNTFDSAQMSMLQ